MAEIKSIYKDKRKTAYVNGNTARKLQVQELPSRNRRRQEEQRPRVHHAGRAKAEHMSFGYTLFLALASVLALWVCAGYLQLQADNTARSKEIATLEEQLADLKTENDDEYNRVTTSVDLEEIRDIAINELGMVYAQADQVVLYDGSGSDYVKQYAEIPQEESSLKGLLGTRNR
jgi:cell division protein FtsL